MNFSFLNPNIIRLMIAACCMMPGASIIVFIGSLLGHELAPLLPLATLPVAMMVVGVAMSTIPATWMLKKFGRKLGSLIGILFGLVGVGCGIPLLDRKFLLSLAAAFFTGTSQAFVQQYRFAAMESAPSQKLVPKVLGFMMMSGIVAAWLGPELALLGKDFILPGNYGGSFLLMGTLSLVAAVVLLGFKNPVPKDEDVSKESSTAFSIIANPKFLCRLLWCCGLWCYEFFDDGNTYFHA